MTMLMNRLRVVLPPDGAMIAFVILYVVMEGPTLYLEWTIGQPLDMVHIGVWIVRGAAFAYGYFRVRWFHPAYLPDYRAWLERGPWTSRKPLPAGPVAMGWEDMLTLGALAALAAARGPWEPARVVTLALLGHAMTLAPILWSTGAMVPGFIAAFGIGLVVRTWPDPRISLASAVGTYLVGWVGLRISLAKFPWPNLPEVRHSNPTEVAKAAVEASCGWPFDQLQPKAPAATPNRHVPPFLSLLAGWYLYAALAVLPNPATTVRLLFFNAIVMLVMGRTLTYCSGYAPPISLWGRIRTFRWIVPGYDQVFLAPACTLLIGVLSTEGVRPGRVDDQEFLPVALALACLVSWTTGPSLARWRLTGRHRITASIAKKGGDFVKVG